MQGIETCAIMQRTLTVKSVWKGIRGLFISSQLVPGFYELTQIIVMNRIKCIDFHLSPVMTFLAWCTLFWAVTPFEF